MNWFNIHANAISRARQLAFLGIPHSAKLWYDISIAILNIYGEDSGMEEE